LNCLGLALVTPGTEGILHRETNPTMQVKFEPTTWRFAVQSFNMAPLESHDDYG